MKLMICGTQAIGKTTLAVALSENLGIPLAPEAARIAALKLGLTDLSVAPLSIMEQFHTEILRIQIETLKIHDDIICDRGSIDTAAHTLLLAPHAKKLLADCKEATKLYTKIIYLPIEFEEKKDGFRYDHKGWRKKQDQTIKMLLSDWKVKFVTITGTHNERLKKTIDYVKNKKI